MKLVARRAGIAVAPCRHRRSDHVSWALALGVFVAACSSTTDATATSAWPPAPAPTPSELLMSAQSFSPACPQPNQTLSPGPVVRVTDRNGRPQRGINVRFETATGQVDRAEAVTGADGTASAGSWTLPKSAGLNAVIASVPGGPSLTFSVTSKAPSPVIAQYDLVAIGGTPLPIAFYHTDGPITAGHYVLAADGTYSLRYELNGQAGPPTTLVCSSAHYSIGLSTIDFYLAPDSYSLSPFYQERNGHFATAIVSGRTMSVKYDDGIDFLDERYELESGFDPIALGRFTRTSLPLRLP